MYRSLYVNEIIQVQMNLTKCFAYQQKKWLEFYYGWCKLNTMKTLEFNKFSKVTVISCLCQNNLFRKAI